MDIFVYIARFIYRIRYKLFFSLLLAIVLSIFFTGFLPTKYNVSTVIFTGITSKTSLDDLSDGTDWVKNNAAHDNIINLVRSKITLEKVSISLLAQHLIHGDSLKDNNYILAKNYKKLCEIVPKEVWDLVDKKSEAKTIENLLNYRTDSRNNFVYALFHWKHPHYSYYSLSEIHVKRKETSDMIEISYECDDPGIASNTVALLNKELSFRYEDLLLSTSKDVVKHFEEQLAEARRVLDVVEDDMVSFNMVHKIINYEEQTKHLASLNNNFEIKYDELSLSNKSSKALVDRLEIEMNTQAKLLRENEAFLRGLSEISSLNSKIAEIEVFGQDDKRKPILDGYKRDLRRVSEEIKNISGNINAYKYSKEGVAIADMVNQWLIALLEYERSTAELLVMDKRRLEINSQYETYSPVGPSLIKKNREVDIAADSYKTILHHLGLAKLKQKNILLNSGTLQVVTPPEYPLLSLPKNRKLYVAAAVFGTLLFVLGFYLIIELIDRTIRDSFRAERIIGGKVIGAFPADQKMKYRGYNNEVKRMATSYIANVLNSKIRHSQSLIVNIISVEDGEGKSMIAKHLKEYWQELGFSVVYLTFGKDFKQDSKQFLETVSVYDLLPANTPHPDMIIIEYANLKTSTVPELLLKEASSNILVVSAKRVWRGVDKTLFEKLKTTIGQDSLSLYLSQADRETVEDYVGQLPPYTELRRLSYRLFSLGITSTR